MMMMMGVHLSLMQSCMSPLLHSGKPQVTSAELHHPVAPVGDAALREEVHREGFRATPAVNPRRRLLQLLVGLRRRKAQLAWKVPCPDDAGRHGGGDQVYISLG